MLKRAGIALLVGVTLMGWSADNGGFDGVGVTLTTLLPFIGIAVLVFAGMYVRDWYWDRWGRRRAVERHEKVREMLARRTPRPPFADL
jgi:hypothetical protein